MKTTTFLLSVAAVMGLATVSRADLINYEADWSGAHFGNAASTATATFTLNTAAFSNPGFNSFIGAASISNAFQNFELTLAGGPGGTAVYHASDFNNIIFVTGAALDFNSELVGQPQSFGGTFGPGHTGDFNLFGNIWGAPNGIAPFEFTAAVAGSPLLLTSLHPVVASPVVAVPEAGTWVMGLLAIGAVIVMARRPAASRD